MAHVTAQGITYWSSIDPLFHFVRSLPDEDAALAAVAAFKARVRARFPEETTDSREYPIRFATLRLAGSAREIEKTIQAAQQAAPPTALRMLQVLLDLTRKALEIAPTLDGRPRPAAPPAPAAWAQAATTPATQPGETTAAQPAVIDDYDFLLG